MLNKGDMVRVLDLIHLNGKYVGKTAEVTDYHINYNRDGNYLVTVKFNELSGAIYAAYYENELEVV